MIEQKSVTIQEIAQFLTISERRVQQLTKTGAIPKSSHGKYELVAATQGYINYLQERTVKRASTSGDYNTEKARLVKLQADKAELELEVMNKNLVPVEQVYSAWTSMLTDIKTKMLTIPAMISPVVAVEDVPGVVQDIIDQSIRDVLRDLSEYDTESDADSKARDDRAPTTKKADRK